MVANDNPDHDLEESTRERLITAAEGLIASRGIDGVSVREITRAAGANAAAVHYHFASKSGLVAEILHRRMVELAERRDRLIDEWEATKGQLEVRDVVEAYAFPLLEWAFDTSGLLNQRLRFLSQVFSYPGPAQQSMRDEFVPQRRRLHHLLHVALPDLPRPLVHFRMLLAFDTIIQHLSNLAWSMTPWSEVGPPPDQQDFVESLIDAVSGMLTAPITAGSGGAFARSGNRESPNQE